jgi:hypothetical protein
VAAGEQRDEDPLEHLVLADDDPPDLVQDRLARQPAVADDCGRRGLGVGPLGELLRCGVRAGRFRQAGLRPAGDPLRDLGRRRLSARRVRARGELGSRVGHR